MDVNIIKRGNCLEIMKLIPDNSIDLIFADPPYWMRTSKRKLKRADGTDFSGCDDKWDQFESLEQYKEFTYQYLKECKRILKNNGSLWIIGSMQCIYTIGSILQDLDFWIINDVIWYKTNPTPNFKGTRLNNSHETLIWATKSKNSKFTFNYKTAKEINHDNVTDEDFYNKNVRKQMGSVWRIPVCTGKERLKDEQNEKLHSTQKPLELLKRIICISSNYGDLVLDPFAGTMTTGVAAKMLGRNYIMIERDKKYCEYGSIRLQQTAKIIDDIALAKYDEKPIKATMKEMIEKGYFQENEDFYTKDGTAQAKLLKNGHLLYDGKEINMHSCIAKILNPKSEKLNGFNYWYVKRQENLIPISEVRENYRNHIKKQNN